MRQVRSSSKVEIGSEIPSSEIMDQGSNMPTVDILKSDDDEGSDIMNTFAIVQL